MIRGVRTLRSEFTIPPEKKVTVKIVTDEGFNGHDYFEDHRLLAADLMKSPNLEILKLKPDAEGVFLLPGRVLKPLFISGMLLIFPRR